MKHTFRCLTTLCLLVGSALVLSCGGHPASPSQVPAATPTAPAPAPTTIDSIRLVSGWDEDLVDIAQVTIAGKTYTPDYDGVVRFPGVPVGARVNLDVAADGFLLRQTYLSGDSAVTLWPADPANLDAIKAMAYTSSGQIARKFYDNDYVGTDDFGISGDFASSPEGTTLFANLRTSGDHLSQVLDPGAPTVFRIVNGSSLADIDVMLDLVEDNACSDAWGFCATASSRPFVVHVSRSAATRQDVALRLLVQLFLQANPQAGLMNREHPSAELSLLEEQTLRMVFLRSYFNRWPDNDRQ